MTPLKRETTTVLVRFFVTLTLAVVIIFPQAKLFRMNQDLRQEDVNDNVIETNKILANYAHKKGDIIICNLSQDSFQAFMSDLSVKTLFEKCDDFSIYRKSTNREGYVQEKIFCTDSSAEDENMSGYFRIGSLPIDIEFIDFMNDRENFKHILAVHDVNEAILSHNLISHVAYKAKKPQLIPPGTYPTMCIWIHTDVGDYFLEQKFTSNNSTNTKFEYTFYDVESYSRKYT